MKARRRTAGRWAVLGVLFGTLFPLVGLLAAATGGSVDFAAAHESQPVLWIVDLAPFVLGVAGFAIGYHKGGLIDALAATDSQVRERTADLRVANDRLEAMVQSKDEFLATVSHELRTPLTVVSGFAQELLNDDVDLEGPESRELLEVIAEQSRELCYIIEDLLVASRADIGKVSIVTEPLDVAEQVRAVVAGCVCSEQDRASFVAELTPAVANVDPMRLRQIVRNLMTNAIRYGGPERCIATHVEGDTVRISVIDNGAGIPEIDRDRIFQSYERSEANGKAAGSVGLGLSVSRKLARMMDGELSYDYREGRSVFTLSLPAASAPVAAVR